MYRQYAILQKGRIAALVSSYPPEKRLKKNQIPLTWDEFLFLRQYKTEGKGIDLDGMKKMIREIEKKIKGAR